MALTSMDRQILARARARLGLEGGEVLHPSLMYGLLRYFWFGKAPVSLFTRHTEFRPLQPVGPSESLSHLPTEYIAVRFYFRPSFPDTPENRPFVVGVIRALSRHPPVVMLNTGLSLDDHEDVEVEDGQGVYRVDRLMTLQGNLDLQTEIISRAQAFVGTYGGLAYLGPLFGVPESSNSWRAFRPTSNLRVAA